MASNKMNHLERTAVGVTAAAGSVVLVSVIGWALENGHNGVEDKINRIVWDLQHAGEDEAVRTITGSAEYQVTSEPVLRADTTAEERYRNVALGSIAVTALAGTTSILLRRG